MKLLTNIIIGLNIGILIISIFTLKDVALSALASANIFLAYMGQKLRDRQ